MTVDLPGIKKDEIQISTENEVLRIQAETKGRLAGGPHVREYSCAWELPHASVDHANITAEYENGELILTLPKAQAAKLRQIQVEAKQQPMAAAGGSQEGKGANTVFGKL